MAMKTEAGTAAELVGSTPPPDYCPGRDDWCNDVEDPFYTPPEERPFICDPNAPPTTGELKKLWAGGLRINRVVPGPKGGYRWAPPIENSGALKMLRPTSPDEIVIDPADPLHTAVWRHQLRRRFAQRQLKAAEQMRANELAQPRCSVCSAVVHTSTPAHYSPWTRGGRVCGRCAAAIDLRGAQLHLAEHQDKIDRYLEQTAG
jgi:hypothetical protein